MVSSDLSNFSNSTVATRGANLKIQALDTLYAQSDYQTKFKALGVSHDLLAGVDIARVSKVV